MVPATPLTRLVPVLLAVGLTPGCASRGAGPTDGAPAPAPAPAPADAPAVPPAPQTGAEAPQPWGGGRGSFCEPGQVNALGVGRACTSNQDCAGLAAAMCQRVKGSDRPAVCSVHCATDDDCGPGAMCGLARGWIRACYPARCTDYAYAPERVRPLDGEPAAHAGALVCDPGFSFHPQGWGKACGGLSECEGLEARGCNQAIYPPGVPRCARECRTDERCGADAYCSHTEVTTFSMCLQRCPAARHRALTEKPAFVDRCRVAGTVVDLSANPHGVGRPCGPEAACPEGSVCGPTLQGKGRRPEGCTRPCSDDADCGRGAVCAALDQGLPEKAEAPARYCIAACWAI